MIKKCSTCQIEKPFEEFNKNKSTKLGIHNQCRSCTKLWKPNPEQRLRYNEKTRQWNRMKRTGFTPEQYELKLAEQENKCGICATNDPGITNWQADHDHETGQTRGILCQKCNTGIGLLRDNPEVLQAAIDYLNKYIPSKENK
jgi:hypothetical protein